MKMGPGRDCLGPMFEGPSGWWIWRMRGPGWLDLEVRGTDDDDGFAHGVLFSLLSMLSRGVT